jgi:hypothetical protein
VDFYRLVLCATQRQEHVFGEEHRSSFDIVIDLDQRSFSPIAILSQIGLVWWNSNVPHLLRDIGNGFHGPHLVK